MILYKKDLNIVQKKGLKYEDNNYRDKYDKEILDRNKNDIYKLIEIEENGYRGYLVAIYDPSKIKVTYSRYLGNDGEYLVDMAKRENAVVALTLAPLYNLLLSDCSNSAAKLSSFSLLLMISLIFK